MLYEIKRTFGKEPLDLTAITTGTAQFAGDIGMNVAANVVTHVGSLDYEATNQHFPNENTLEVIGWEDATSDGAATLTLTLQDSADGSTFGDVMSFTIGKDAIKVDALLFRGTIPAGTRRYMRLKLDVGTANFTAGEILALVRPL